MTRATAERILRLTLATTLIGLVVIVVLAIVIADQRGLLLAIGAAYLVSSLAGYFFLRRSLSRELARVERERAERG